MSFPDANALLIAYITPLHAPVAVVSRVPDPRPQQLIQVRRVGGSAAPPVRDSARLDIWTWAPTDADAMALALTVRSEVWKLAGTTLLGPVCYRVQEFLAPRLADDPVTNSPRAWATYQLDLRAEDVISPAPPSP
ncbi:hypothetical protein QCN29_26765 [Streptomyces sp. HNM0663]|uniref:DUF3168 domain-containing protein n=1 Tax=Streptomyces chengmaiensis TaxID=3040919 RepID=A0ABT6HWT0_9ACTN|nr:hypothetical protein [Streptomyces chengmaiensis]MDH2392314.1 hypothetical protein [Streptomyces chengmaiensis]